MGGKQQRLWAALKLPDQRRESEEGDVETGRGKKGKKAWQLNLRLIDVICTGIGIVGLMCISFFLGALAGRGDIYRVAYSLGLLSPEVKQTAQITPPSAPAPAAAEAPAASPVPVAAEPASAAAPQPAVAAAAASASAGAKSPHPAPVAGSMAPLPQPPAAASSKKKAKSAQALHEQKARDEQLRQHQDVAKKMTFLNSFDSTPKPGLKKDKDKSKAGAAKPQPATQVKVATYRDRKSAQAKLAELQKKGVKASMKQGKNAQGTTFTVYRQAPAPAPAHPKEPEKVAQTKEKPGSARKPQTE